jgi:DNA-binding CsgD family transcriptional regulator
VPPVLAFFERYFRLIQSSRNDDDLVQVMKKLALEMGFRGAFLVEYGLSHGFARRVLDTLPDKDGWWEEFFRSDRVKDNPHFDRVLAGPELLVFDQSRFGPGEDAARKLAERGDMVDCLIVPLGEAGRIVGSFGLRGTGHFTALQQEALQFVAHSLFAQFRSLHDEEVGNGKAALTRREREVIRLSAEGMTSVQIAKMLGMSARTANQHFDNVADKLGTRNRAHTVAEVIRRGLLE